ncbi:hypothetical protein NXX40_22815 [Parabacteroides distasonis]|nr:hypothetical protein [Parabacteroides distasonis]
MTKTRVKTELAAAIVLVLVGCFLLIAGIFIPPIGTIHPSVPVAFGEIAVFAGSLFGIDLHYRPEFHKIKAEVGADKIEDK